MTSDDKESRFEWLAEGNRKQARKRVSAKAVIRDQEGRILLVNPTYKDCWDLPGGMAEANEPPTAALVREVAEELALTVSAGKLLALDWVGPRGPWDDQLIFVFDGGALPGHVIDSMKIADSELSEFKFFSVHDAKRLLRDDVADRLERAVSSLRTSAMHFREYGSEVTDEP